MDIDTSADAQQGEEFDESGAAHGKGDESVGKPFDRGASGLGAARRRVRTPPRGRPGRMPTRRHPADPGAAAGAIEPGPRAWQQLQDRVLHLEQQLERLRRSRGALVQLLWRLDDRWRRRLEALEAENRRLRRRCASGVWKG